MIVDSGGAGEELLRGVRENVSSGLREGLPHRRSRAAMLSQFPGQLAEIPPAAEIFVGGWDLMPCVVTGRGIAPMIVSPRRLMMLRARSLDDLRWLLFLQAQGHPGSRDSWRALALPTDLQYYT